MTLDELLKEHYKAVGCIKQTLDHCNEMFTSGGCSKCKYNTQLTFDDITPFLEELKDLRVELEKSSKELKVYRELLNTACDVILSIAPTHHKTRKDVMENLYLIIGGGKDESL